MSKIIISSKGYDRFQEPEEDDAVECCRCGRMTPMDEVCEKNDQYYCDVCYDDMFST